MIIMITVQWYFFVKILAIPLKLAYEKREWMLIDLSEHLQLYRTEMAEVISTKPLTLWSCRWWHDSPNFRMKNLYKKNRKCRWKRIQGINESPLKIQSEISSGGNEVIICNFKKIYITEHQRHMRKFSVLVKFNNNKFGVVLLII
jgi:hypothetical protein